MVFECLDNFLDFSLSSRTSHYENTRCYFSVGLPRTVCAFVSLKGHSQLMHMRIRYHFLADLHVTRHERETESEKRIWNTQNKPC